MNALAGSIAVGMVAALVSAAPALAQQTQRTAIVATQSVAEDGALAGPVTVIISNGVIERVSRGSTSLRGIEEVVRVDGVLCPGFIDLCSALGMTGGRSERSATIDPTLTAAEGYDPSSAESARAAATGITSALVCTDGNQIVGGVASLVSTGDATGGSAIVRAEGPLMITLAPSTWDADSGPSSRAGALFELREALSEAQRASGQSRLNRFGSGQLGGIIRTDSYEDLDAALNLAVSLEIVPTMLHTDDAVDAAAILENWSGIVVVGPYHFSSDVRVLSGAKALGDAGVEVAFAGNSVVDSLRRSAHLAVRYGLDAAAARRGLTVNAARVAGATGTVGTLAQGARADLVVWSADPLRLDARPLNVWVGGVPVSDHVGAGWSDEEHLVGQE